MKLHLLFPIFFVLILAGCSQRAAKPKPFLNEKRMVELLTEIHLTEAALQQFQSDNYATLDSILVYTNVAYTELFEKYGLNKESFEANLYYRVYNSRDLERIYAEVHSNLHRLDSLNRLTEFEVETPTF